MLIDYCCSLPAEQIVAQYLTWLMLITIAIGKYLMNGYSVVKEQPIHRYVNGKQVKDYPLSFTCFLT
ncbi:MAG: hypothetical protein IJE78_04145 [Bacteroidaceae bacterium]|nr:hypothetical protein [Bacteroidaceae bacterium]